MKVQFRQFKQSIHEKLIFKFSKVNRLGISANFIKGEGIEIGALDYPLRVSPEATVKYVDRISAEAHAKIFTDMSLSRMVKVDIIDDGETLLTIGDATQDFVIANHFIEHCQNPAQTIENLLRVVRKGGIVFMAIPDKRYTFDINRELTSMAHFLKDYREGASWSEGDHYEDFVRKTVWSKDAKTDDDIKKVIAHLKEINFSIHFHVWSHPTMIDFFQMLRHELSFPFEIELSVAPQKNSNEGVFILKKT